MWKWRKPFKVVRVTKHRGGDKPGDVFGVVATGNGELVATGESAAETVINGSMGSHPKDVRRVQQRLCDELNAVFDRYMRGEFHA